MGGSIRAGGRDQSGFTLVELLVVLLIVGLLAAIAVPAFFGQRDKARDAEAKLQAHTAQAAMETYATDHDNDYRDATSAELQKIEPSLRELDSSELTVQVMGSSGQYRISVAAPTGNVFSLRRNGDGSMSFTCTAADRGGCPPGGIWGG
jgi:type IV pilus assembly protein PilA